MIRSSPKLTQEQLLTLYGLFKQAKEGDNARSKPAFYEMEASAKHEAWEKCRGLSQHEAKELYIKHANLYDSTIGKKLIDQMETPPV
jgi:acyl-CoA-binding protein